MRPRPHGALRRLKKLYAKIPQFDCKPGCHACCGPIFMSRLEWDQFRIKKIAGLIDSCPYVSRDGCIEYEHRPIICRLFGASDDPLLKCTMGCGPEKRLTIDETEALFSEYMRLIGFRGQVHEA